MWDEDKLDHAIKTNVSKLSVFRAKARDATTGSTAVKKKSKKKRGKKEKSG